MVTTDAGRVVVVATPTGGQAVPTTQAHHRDFPELHAEGETASQACAHLRNLLDHSLSAAPVDDRREAIERAIADVKEYLARNP
jgi:hypothetical protein